jgi:uncharacterized protein (DUF488 family)
MSRIGIGVYGHTLESFLDALKEAKTTSLIDIRRFRGMRGAKYRWANSNALQTSLKQVGISYRHEIDLSPTRELRTVQKQSDVQTGVGKSNRENLNPAFIADYRAQVGPHLSSELLESLSAHTAFLCVESSDTACHRSVLLQLLKEVERD